MDKGSMVESLVNYYCDGNKAQFANMLGKTPQTISNWIDRNTFDAELIYTKCEGVSGDWLLSGVGNMIKGEVCKQNVNNPRDGELLQFCKMIVANYQERDALMSKLVDLVKKG